MFRPTRFAKCAAQLPRRAEDEAPAARHITGERTDLRGTLRVRRRSVADQADQQAERADRDTEFIEDACYLSD